MFKCQNLLYCGKYKKKKDMASLMWLRFVTALFGRKLCIKMFHLAALKNYNKPAKV